MPQTDEWTVLRLLTWTTDYLKKRGLENARLEAEVLLAQARGCQRIELYAQYNQTAEEEVRAAYRELIRRRIEGTPVAYLVGKKEFYSHSFRVNHDVLIPRPETEDLVSLLLDAIQEHRSNEAALDDRRTVEVADLGTGSGIIAICTALHAARVDATRVQVTAIDISAAALEVARLNAEDHGVLEQVELVESNWFEAVPPERQFDFIVGNPPYVRQEEYDHLPADIKNHEPRLALLAGATGVEAISPLISQAADRLRSGGRLMIEISPMIEEEVMKLFQQNDRYEPATIHKVNHLPRIINARRK